MAEHRRRASELPLFRWGAELRADRLRRRRLGTGGAAIGALVLALGLTVAIPPRPILVGNASASAPVGFYLVGSGETPDPGEMVIARVPKRYRLFAARRHYLPANVPLVKRVAAAPGDRVCALATGIWVNGSHISERRKVDRKGRPMPWWRGCVTLRDGALFLLMDDPASFDGRYFGPTEAKDVIGKAQLLWPL